MTRYVFRGLGARKLRTALTALAVVLGVAMISGTYVLTDTIDKAFSDVFQTASEGVDVSVTGAKPAGFGRISRPTYIGVSSPTGTVPASAQECTATTAT